jgi:hypothetical protein
MKRVRLRSVEDVEGLPEDEWVEVVGGMKFTSTDETIRVENEALIVPLPENVRKRFRKGANEDLRAKISKGILIVTRHRASKPKREG